MQHLEVSVAVRLIYRSLGVRGLIYDHLQPQRKSIWQENKALKILDLPAQYLPPYQSVTQTQVSVHWAQSISNLSTFVVKP